MNTFIIILIVVVVGIIIGLSTKNKEGKSGLKRTLDFIHQYGAVTDENFEKMMETEVGFVSEEKDKKEIIENESVDPNRNYEARRR